MTGDVLPVVASERVPEGTYIVMSDDFTYLMAPGGSLTLVPRWPRTADSWPTLDRWEPWTHTAPRGWVDPDDTETMTRHRRPMPWVGWMHLDETVVDAALGGYPRSTARPPYLTRFVLRQPTPEPCP